MFRTVCSVHRQEYNSKNPSMQLVFMQLHGVTAINCCRQLRVRDWLNSGPITALEVEAGNARRLPRICLLFVDAVQLGSPIYRN